DAAARAAARRGYQVRREAEPLRGEAGAVGARIAAQLRQCPRGCALIMGGETTVTVRGGGTGGRNQELALAAALALGDADRAPGDADRAPGDAAAASGDADCV